MQTMNTDQPLYYQNPTAPHQAQAGYYMQNPMGQPTYAGSQRMPYFHPGQMNNTFAAPQLYYPQTYTQNPPFVHTTGPRGMNPSYPTIIRPSNENPTGAQTFIPSAQYPNNNIYPNQYSQYPMPHTYTQTPVSTQISNQPQPQYPAVNNQQITQSPTASQQSSDPQHGQASQSSQSRDNVKRERKPLAIVDPDSKKPVEVPAPVPPVTVSSTIPAAATTTDENAQKESVTNSTIPNSKSSEDINKSQIQAKFRQQVAQLLNPNAETDKNANQTSTEETSTENLPPQSTSSRPTSRSGSISTKSSEQPQPGYPGIRTGSIAEDKTTVQDNVEQEIEIVAADDSKSTPTDTTDTSQNESFEFITSAQLNDSESEPATLGKTPSLSKRFDYTIEELRNKRSNPVSQERPMQLPEIPGVTTPRKPKPKVDGDDRFLREVRAILNKLTPQTYDTLVTKLEALELNSAKRLEGMITVVFVKAVEAAIFCSLYAKLCKHFEKKQVTVPDENGQLVKHYFRQLLLSRCQKEFENDYRQEIRYEQRKIEVDAMTDEKAQREAAEDLEEDFLKAKRKKLGNIIFIGELFKLHMLIDTIMYDCIDYLLRDKADEEGLECLCRLLRTIGKELELKASEKVANKKSLEKNFVELENISTLKQTSSRIRFMIQDLLEQRKADWVLRRAEVKPMTIDEIHETERIKREEQEQERNNRRDTRPSGGGGGGNNNPPYYTGRGSGSRGSGMKHPSNRNDADRSDNRLVVNSIRQFQTNDKRNQGLPFSLAPQGAWSKGSGVDKKTEDDRANAARTGKPPVGANQQFRPKPGTPPGTPNYGVQRQPSRELARESSQRDRENAMQSLRKTTNQNEPTSPKNISTTDSREGSRNVSREQSRNPSRESSVNERVLPSTKPTTTAPLDEEKTQTRVVSLIKEYTENYSDNDERPVNEAIEDLLTFCTDNIDQQGIIVRELFTNVLEAKSRARKAVGHLLDAALQKNIISTEGFLSGIKLFVEVVPDYAVDIPLIWQYIGEILGALIGAPSSNMILIKSILPLIPENKSKQLFQYIIRYAVEFSSKATVQKFWQSTNLSLNDLFKSDSIDSSFTNEYNWLSETTSNKEIPTPNADQQLVKLFKSINDQSTTVSDDQILAYIQENMKPDDKFYIRNIVLSYLEACLIIRDEQKKIQDDIAKKRLTVLNTIIDHRLEHEIQAVYAIQNFIHKLEHPPKMARLLFDIFYDEECVTEEAFLEWRKQLDPAEHEGHSVVEISTRDFFTWLQQAEEEEEEEE